MMKSKPNRFCSPFLILCFACFLLSLSLSAQEKYQSLLWEISGNGLEKPSYLYGTMHVSNKVAFYLGDPFYEALESADQVALEMNPEEWFDEVLGGDVMNSIFRSMGPGKLFGRGNNSNPYEKRMISENKDMITIQNLFRANPEMINSLLFRFQDPTGNFEENTWLDMFIFQCAGKLGKETVGLETFDLSMSLMEKAMKESMDEKNTSLPHDFDYSDQIRLQQEIEDAYRKGDLDLLDSLSTLTTASSFKQYILIERNHNFIAGMDTLMRQGSLFTGVGAAHLPGKEGCIDLLRKRGYTVEPIDRGGRDDKRTDKLSDLHVNRPLRQFTSSDGQVSFKTPYNSYGISTSSRSNGYLSMDITNGLTFTVDRFLSQAGVEGKSALDQKKEFEALLYEIIPGDIMKQKDSEMPSTEGFDILHKSGRGDYMRSMVLFTEQEIFVIRLSGSGSKIKKGAGDHFFSSLNISPSQYQELQSITGINGNFTAEMPGRLTTYCLDSQQTTISNDFLAQSIDQEGNVYHLQHVLISDLSYIEDDKYLLEQMALAYEADINQDILSQEFATHDGYATLTVEHGEYLGKSVTGHYVICGTLIYALHHFGENEAKANTFFHSLSFKQNDYPESYPVTDSAGFFTSVLPYEYEESSLGGMFGLSLWNKKETNETSEYEYTVFYTPPGTSDEIEVEYYRYDKYFTISNLDEHIEELVSYSTLDGDLVEESRDIDNTDTGFIFNQVLSDSLSHLRIATHAIQDKNRLLTVRCAFDDRIGPSTMFNEFIEHLTLLDDSLAVPVMVPTEQRLMEDLRSEDTVLYRAARDYLVDNYNIMPDEEEYKVFSSLNENPPALADDDDKKEFEEAYNQLRFVEGNERMMNLLVEEYTSNEDSAYYQMQLLSNLLRFKKKEAVEQAKKLIVDSPPIGISTGFYEGMFYFFEDSLELSALLYPELLELVEYEEYKDPVLIGLNMLLDSALISPNLYEYKLDYLIRQTKLKTKRAVSNAMVFDPESHQWNDYMSIERHWNLIYPHKDSPQVKEIFDQIESSNKLELKKTYYHFLKRKGERVDGQKISALLDGENLLEDYSFLHAMDRTDLAPQDTAWQHLFISSNLENQWGNAENSWNNLTVDSVTFVSKSEGRIRTHDFEVFRYTSRHTEKDEEPEWRMTIVMIDKKSSMPNFSYLIKSEKMAQNSEEVEEQWTDLERKLIASKRNYPFHNSGYNDGYYGFDGF